MSTATNSTTSETESSGESAIIILIIGVISFVLLIWGYYLVYRFLTSVTSAMDSQAKLNNLALGRESKGS
jgi:uncharacterized protein YqhQ